MASQVTLFDLPSKDGNLCWSLNSWKSKEFPLIELNHCKLT